MFFNLNIPRPTGELVDFPIKTGDKVFILGANGTGKSSLMQWIYTSYFANARWISAHRQNFFTSNTMDFSPREKQSYETAMRDSDIQRDARWKDNYANQRTSIAIYDLINVDHLRNRAITLELENNNIEAAESLCQKDSPIKVINELLRLSNIPIEISFSGSDQVVAMKSGGTPYSIAELSDGERNALVIAANVLTVKSGTLVLIDEPERHLHRSIISPLLTHLFSKRDDCAFIVSTHDVMLPLDNPNARTLLIRGCTYAGSSVNGWDVDSVEPETQIDDEIKKDILGARRKILFVEGKEDSLDKPLYSLVFPNVSIIAKSNCREVEHTVSSIRACDTLLWVHAVGIVDKDGRPDTEIDLLRQKGIYALSAYSVESIYYHPHIQNLIAQRKASINGGDASTYINNAKAAAIEGIKQKIKHLSDRIAEKAIREEFFLHVPKKPNIERKIPIEVNIDVAKFVEDEYKRLEDELKAGNLEAIICRYPVRETPALDWIAKALEFQNSKQYERAVRKLLIDDKEALTFVKSMFGDLVSDLEPD